MIFFPLGGTQSSGNLIIIIFKDFFFGLRTQLGGHLIGPEGHSCMGI
jgi:hypothetical protein